MDKASDQRVSGRRGVCPKVIMLSQQEMKVARDGNIRYRAVPSAPGTGRRVTGDARTASRRQVPAKLGFPPNTAFRFGSLGEKINTPVK